MIGSICALAGVTPERVPDLLEYVLARAREQELLVARARRAGRGARRRARVRRARRHRLQLRGHAGRSLRRARHRQALRPRRRQRQGRDREARCRASGKLRSPRIRPRRAACCTSATHGRPTRSARKSSGFARRSSNPYDHYGARHRDVPRVPGVVETARAIVRNASRDARKGSTRSRPQLFRGHEPLGSRSQPFAGDRRRRLREPCAAAAPRPAADAHLRDGQRGVHRQAVRRDRSRPALRASRRHRARAREGRDRRHAARRLDREERNTSRSSSSRCATRPRRRSRSTSTRRAGLQADREERRSDRPSTTECHELCAKTGPRRSAPRDARPRRSRREAHPVLRGPDARVAPRRHRSATELGSAGSRRGHTR